MGEALDILMKRFNGTDYDELYPIGKTDSPSVKTTHPKLPFDGITNPELLKVLYNNGMFVCLFKDATYDYVACSKDCETWSVKTRLNTGSASSQRFKEMAYGLGHFIVVGTGSKYAYSTDGVNWYYGDMPTTVTHDWKIDGCENGILAMSNFTDNTVIRYMDTWGIWLSVTVGTPLTDGVDMVIAGKDLEDNDRYGCIISGRGRVILSARYGRWTDWQVNANPTVTYSGNPTALDIYGGFWDYQNSNFVLLTDIFESESSPHNQTFVYSHYGATWTLGKDMMLSKAVDCVIGWGGGSVMIIDSTVATDYAYAGWGYFDNNGIGGSSGALGTSVMPVSLQWKQVLCVGSHFYAFPKNNATVYVHDVDALFYNDSEAGDWVNEVTHFVSGRDGTIVNDELAKALIPLIAEKMGIPSWNSMNIMWQLVQSYMIERGSYSGSESSSSTNTKTLWLSHPHSVVLLWGFYSGSATKFFILLNAVPGASNVKQYSTTDASSTTDATTVGDATIKMINSVNTGDGSSYKCVLSGRYINTTNYKYKYIAI